MKSIRKPKTEPVEFPATVKVPFRYPANMWDYEPCGPVFRFELYHAETIGASPQIFEMWDGFDNVMDRFASFGLPQWWGSFCWVLDSNDVVILGYASGHDHREGCGPYGWWIGVGASFKALEARYDQMEVAVWETMARETVW